MMKKLMLAVSVVALLACQSAFGAVWSSNAGGYWDQGTAWWTGTPPTAADEAGIGDGAITVRNSAAASTTYVLYSDKPLNIISGGTLTTKLSTGTWDGNNAITNVNGGAVDNSAGRMWLGMNPNSSGTLNINSGSVAVGEWLMIGNDASSGTLNMNGGTLSVTAGIALNPYNPTAGKLAYFNLDGGVATVGDLWVNQGVIDIGGGTLLLPGDKTMLISNLIGWGNLTGYDGIGTVLYDFNSSNVGYTTVTAIPEPVSIALLGLGALLFVRKK